MHENASKLLKNDTKTTLFAPFSRLLLASLALSILMPSLDTSIANAGLPTLAESFHASFPAVQWIVVAYLLSLTALSTVAGRLGDKLGRRRVLLGGIALFTVASMLCGIAPTLWILVAARALQGLGAAVMLALTMASAGDAAPKDKLGGIMGLLGSMSAIGTTLGPPLGGLMMAGLGWRSIFLVNVPLGILNFLLARRCLPPDQPAAATPLIQWDLLRDRRVAVSLGLSALVSMVMMSTLVVGPFYLARALGLSTKWMGLALAAGPMVAALAGVPAGRLVDRYGARPMTGAGLVGIAAGCVAIAAMPAWFGVAGYLLPLVSVTASYALFQAANNTSLMSGVRAEQRGVTAGVLNLSRNLGLIAGASAMGAVFAFGIGNSDVSAARPEAVATGMRLTFAVSAALIAAGLAVAMRLANPGAAPRPSACEWRPAPATERPVQ